MDMEVLLGQTLEVAEQPGLEAFDPRFTEISTLVQNGDYKKAAEQSGRVLDQGVYDIRIIGYFAYGVFLDQGIAGLASVFEALTWTLSNNREAIGPAKHRDTHTQNSLKWLCSQVNKKLIYEEGKKSEVWNAWIEESDSEQAQSVIEALDAFQKEVEQDIGDKAGEVLDELAKTKAWFRSFKQLVYKEPPPEVADEEEREEVPGEDPPPPRKDAARDMVSPSGPTRRPGLSMDVSPHLESLLQKLDTFETLIQMGKFPLAALVAEDINGILADFDPRTYFPRMFAKFSLLFARHIQILKTYEAYKDTIEWQVVNNLYRVDLENFIDFDAEFLANVTPPMPDREYSEPDDEDGIEEETAHETSDDDYDNI